MRRHIAINFELCFILSVRKRKQGTFKMPSIEEILSAHLPQTERLAAILSGSYELPADASEAIASARAIIGDNAAALEKAEQAALTVVNRCAPDRAEA